MKQAPNMQFHRQIYKAGLHKLCHPAFPDGRTWTKLGEHGKRENMEKTENINQMYVLNTLFMISNTHNPKHSISIT